MRYGNRFVVTFRKTATREFERFSKSGFQDFMARNLPGSSRATITTTGNEAIQLQLEHRATIQTGEEMDDLEITPAEMKARLDGGEKLVLVDVREPWEYQVCRIEGAKLVPLG